MEQKIKMMRIVTFLLVFVAIGVVLFYFLVPKEEEPQGQNNNGNDEEVSQNVEKNNNLKNEKENKNSEIENNVNENGDNKSNMNEDSESVINENAEKETTEKKFLSDEEVIRKFFKDLEDNNVEGLLQLYDNEEIVRGYKEHYEEFKMVYSDIQIKEAEKRVNEDPSFGEYNVTTEATSPTEEGTIFVEIYHFVIKQGKIKYLEFLDMYTK